MSLLIIPSSFAVKDLCHLPGAGLEWPISMVNEGVETGILKAVLVLLQTLAFWPAVHTENS